MLAEINEGDEIKDTEMGAACSTHGSYEKCVQHFSRKTVNEEITCKTMA
jgi:hypothetical protein